MLSLAFHAIINIASIAEKIRNIISIAASAERKQEIHVKDIDTMKPELHLESMVYEIDQQCFN